jgi:prevent-host-death family protein
MKSVKIAELKDRLSEHLRSVERGAEVTVTDRSRPIARIVPIAEAQPGLTIVSPKVTFKSIRGRRRRRARWAMRSNELLAEERRER